MKWKLFDGLLVHIVTEEFTGIGDTDNVIGCLGQYERRVAELIVRDHNAAITAAQAEVERLQARLDTIRKTLPESWYAGLKLELRVGYLVEQWRKLHEVTKELEQRAEAAKARVAELEAEHGR